MEGRSLTNFINVKDIQIGVGTPKICVPMTGRTMTDLLAEADLIQSNRNYVDLVEWRVDFFNEFEDLSKVMTTLSSIHGLLEDLPLVFTFRSLEEGGEREIHPSYYFELNKAAAKSGMVDIVDVEIRHREEDINQLLYVIHENGRFGILSSHNFAATPSKSEMVEILERAKKLGGDIPKIAVMPTSARDVLALLEATVEMQEKYPETPIITMSMAGQGAISRLSGEVFGSSVTFGALKKASAPGQIEVADLKRTLEMIHHSLLK
jgi:3-dehydroquinate dehydratase I